ncbi:MAG: hypothetical protein GXO65_07660 [Euryarchaeota archaeon]|nr:hypothetical protein [Euryarchaeota archaeon]
MRLPLLFLLLALIPPAAAMTEGGVIAYTIEDYASYAFGIALILAGSAILYTALK